jgi:hypothetical protein
LLEAIAKADLLFSPESSASEFVPTGKRKRFSAEESLAADALMREAVFRLGFDAVLGIVSAHADRDALVATFGKKPKLAVVESCGDGVPAVAFLHEASGLWITSPYESFDGLFTVDPFRYYGIAEDFACAIDRANRRFAAFLGGW